MRGLRLGLGLTRVGTSAAAAFTPASLFTGQVGGFWTLAQANVFSDTAGTVPITDGGSIARVNDLSGNGNHLIQATAANRPLWVANSGKPYASFDGTNDVLAVTIASITQPFDRISGLQHNSWVSSHVLLSSNTNTAGRLVDGGASSPRIYTYAGSFGPFTDGLVIGTDGVVTERQNGVSSSIQVDLGTAGTGDAGAGIPGGLAVGAYVDGTIATTMRWQGTFMRNGTLSGAEKLQVQQYMAALQGRTI